LITEDQTMAAPRQMTSETLNALKGWPSQSALDFSAKLSSDITDRVPAGACVHVNAAGEFALGVGTTDRMPLFTFQASDDPDVANESGDPATEVGVMVPISPSGAMMALVATGGFELVTTNFVDDTYEPNDLLTSADSGDDAGKLEIGTKGTDMIVGIVSRGVVDNGYGHDALAFWPCIHFTD
jgi:hypothetical protein